MIRVITKLPNSEFALWFQVISPLGESVKQAVAQTATTAQPHVDAIKTSGQAILKHGKNVLQALKNAVTEYSS